MRRVRALTIVLATLALTMAAAPAAFPQNNCPFRAGNCNILPDTPSQALSAGANSVPARGQTASLLPAASSAVVESSAFPANGGGGQAGGGGDDDNRDHFELGVFADYVRLRHADTGFWGLGGRIGFGVAPHVNLEAQMAYDFERNVTTTGTVLGTAFTQRNGLRLLHGTFGPLAWFGSKSARAFLFAKGGFLNFSVSGAAPVSGFTTALDNFTEGDTNGVFYPGGGFAFSAGPIGLRVDVGDLMYIDNGANHNLVVQFGPTLRF
ncbi:MAG: hypothetical protein ACE14L_13425 [Terriglobales bacterium]